MTSVGNHRSTSAGASVDELVLETACRQNLAWQDQGHPPTPIAVNVSAEEFRCPEFFETVTRVLAETRLAPEYLELELTERIVMDDAPTAIDLLHKLRALGVRLAIDDFGKGYSSLGYLRRLPVDKLKIDRSFIRGIEHVSEDRAIAHTVITLARNLHLQVVAEGVETEGQERVLHEQGCDQAQGYLFGRPAPASEHPSLQ